MANPPRSRKRVRAGCPAIRRAPDGSAFSKCEKCGASVAVALIDMHECSANPNVKRFKGIPEPVQAIRVQKKDYEEPRSPFIFFVESYAKTCKGRDLIEINREAFQKWKNMSTKDRWPYILQSQEVDKAYEKFLHQEINQMSQVYVQECDDEADSAEVGKFDHQQYEDYEDSDIYGCENYECCAFPGYN